MLANEKEAMKVAVENILIDGQNKKEVMELIVPCIINDCPGARDVLVINALEEKRIERAMVLRNQGLENSKIFKMLMEEFSLSHRGIINSILNVVAVRLDKEE
ncbi:MAG: hypothetical protein ACTSXG_03260 [Alphaproteobacteria bacterium]